MQTSAQQCAREALEVVPLVMRAIRAEMHSQRTPDLSVPQFRTLAFLNRQENASLSDVAEHLGLTLPSMSKMIDGLVERDLVARQTAADDRRRITLTLTVHGKSILQSAVKATQARLAEMLEGLTPEERAALVQAMRALRPIFTPGRMTRNAAVR